MSGAPVDAADEESAEATGPADARDDPDAAVAAGATEAEDQPAEPSRAAVN